MTSGAQESFRASTPESTSPTAEDKHASSRMQGGAACATRPGLSQWGLLWSVHRCIGFKRSPTGLADGQGPVTAATARPGSGLHHRIGLAPQQPSAGLPARGELILVDFSGRLYGLAPRDANNADSRGFDADWVLQPVATGWLAAGRAGLVIASGRAWMVICPNGCRCLRLGGWIDQLAWQAGCCGWLAVAGGAEIWIWNRDESGLGCRRCAVQALASHGPELESICA